MTDTTETLKAQLLEAITQHVPFDGWSTTSYTHALGETGIDPALARALFPRGAVDLAIAYHDAGDLAMVAALRDADLSGLKFREKIAFAVRKRLEWVDDKELVRRGTTLFALPQYAGDGARAIWGTCDLIWNTLGDASDDFNWYTKRGMLAGVYSSTVLYWLGDESEDHSATWAFLDRRIENVMQIEKLKAQVNKNPLLSRVMTGPNWVLSQIKPPKRPFDADLPGRMATTAPTSQAKDT